MDDPTARRDAGLRRVSRATRTAVAGGLVATGAFSVLAARAVPGTDDSRTAAVPASPTSPSTSVGPSTTLSPSPTVPEESDDQLQAPALPPRSSRRAGRATSGGS